VVEVQQVGLEQIGARLAARLDPATVLREG